MRRQIASTYEHDLLALHQQPQNRNACLQAYHPSYNCEALEESFMFARAKSAAWSLGFGLWAAGLTAHAATPAAGALEQAYAALQDAAFIDLTHEFGPGTPHWKGFKPETVTTLYTIPKDGFHAESFCHPGQWGTHVDPPAHFHDGLKTVDQIDRKKFLLRLVVLDIHQKVA